MKTGLIFGGTLDGRVLAETLVSYGYCIHLCVATECGKDMIALESEHLTVHVGRLSIEEMQSLMQETNCDMVIDATHPYAVEVTKNIKEACGELPYIRMLREASDLSYGTVVASIEEACKEVSNGMVLATTGSKEIIKYKVLQGYQKRLFARVLPTEESINLCKEAGLDDNHIIKHLGVCSVEENIEIIKKYGIQTLITKDGGKTGGFQEKMSACKREGVKFVVIKRTSNETGYSLDKLLEKFEVDRR